MQVNQAIKNKPFAYIAPLNETISILKRNI
jgi:hypothetical protein